jgi:hypothetical protein
MLLRTLAGDGRGLAQTGSPPSMPPQPGSEPILTANWTGTSLGVLHLVPGHEPDFDPLFESRGDAANNLEGMTSVIRNFES